MLDYLKIRLYDIPPSHFVTNPHLDFGREYKIITGEVKEYPLTAKYFNMEIIIRSRTFTEIRGSLHKYFHNGQNWNDFTFEEAKVAILRLCNDLKLDPKKCLLANLEFGVNINWHKEPEHFLKSLICFKLAKPFSIMKSNRRVKLGYDCYLRQYGVKIYNKKLQYSLNENIIRFEVKVTTMEFLHPIKSLYNLMEKGTWEHLTQELIETFESVLIADYSVDRLKLNKAQIKIYENGLNPKYWERLHENNRKTAFYYRENFKAVQARYGHEKSHTQFKGKIVSKTKELLKSSDVLTNLLELKMGQTDLLFERSKCTNFLETLSYSNNLM